MTDRINPTGVAGVRPRPDQVGESRTSGRDAVDRSQDFKAMLERARAERVRFSSHAVRRLEKRRIELNRDDLALLSEGMRRAEAKGSKESLLLMDETAFVVNVSDRKVITAVDREEMKEKTFTNIDSAILLSKKS